jgi:predicted nucleic-acid-binding protein
VRIIADTNVLVRAAVQDDLEEGRLASDALRSAERIAVTLPTLCEFAWVLARGYGKGASEIAAAIRRLVASATVDTDRPAAEAGLAMLEKGGDFADGIIVFEGRRLGGEIFVTFDRKAAAFADAFGSKALHLSKRKSARGGARYRRPRP